MATTTQQRGALLRAAALGAASGARSTAGLTSIALTSSRADTGIARSLGGRAGSVVTGLAAVGELLADKHPSTPSRLGLPGLLPRLVLGATAGAGLARREGRSVVPAAVAAAVAAAAWSVLGNRLRARLGDGFGSDLPGALAEDAAAFGLAWFGGRRGR
ncbi:hypothetical protein [Saccharothrix lopnurensis]|uniref:DUF4126 domain-containing protein n=1 Tax=Saccharothrix lopnurensis TaxID=1670621 RepID=A0ABW1PAA6_9PSEU